MVPRENYFLLLDLDPHSAPSEVERRIRAKQDEWTSACTTGPPARRIKAKGQLEKLPDIKAVLLSEDSRRAEAAAALTLLEKRKREARGALDTHIELLRANPFFTDGQLAASAKALGLSPADVEAAFIAAGLKRGERQGPKSNKRGRLESATSKAIADGLDAVGHSTLYEFLGMSAGARAAALLRRALELEAQVQRAGKTDANANARQLLINQCRQVFRDDAEKEKYDNEIYFRPMEIMRPVIDLAGSDGLINHAEFQLLLANAKKAGIDEKLAREYLADYASANGWTLVTEEALGSSPLGTTSPKPDERPPDNVLAQEPKANQRTEPTQTADQDRGRNNSFAIVAAVFLVLVVGGIMLAAGHHPAGATSVNGTDITPFTPPVNYRVKPANGALKINVRAGPGIDFNVSYNLDAGAQVTGNGRAFAKNGKPWVAITNSDGVAGFVNENLLEKIDAASPAATPLAVPQPPPLAVAQANEPQNAASPAPPPSNPRGISAKLTMNPSAPFDQIEERSTFMRGSPVGISINYSNMQPGDKISAAIYSNGFDVGDFQPWIVTDQNQSGNCWFRANAMNPGVYFIRLKVNDEIVGNYFFTVLTF